LPIGFRIRWNRRRGRKRTGACSTMEEVPKSTIRQKHTADSRFLPRSSGRLENYDSSDLMTAAKAAVQRSLTRIGARSHVPSGSFAPISLGAGYFRSSPMSDTLGVRRHVARVPCVDGCELARTFFTYAGLVGAASVRPVGAVRMTAGHNALRGSGPGQQPAFDNAMALVGCPDRRIDRLCVTCCSPSQPSHHAGCPARSRYAASAASRKPRRSYQTPTRSAKWPKTRTLRPVP
jgi:hypothetical protein